MRKIFFFVSFIFLSIFTLFFSFTLFNYFPYEVPFSSSSIGSGLADIKTKPSNTLKIMTYNIQYGTGLNHYQKQIDKKGVIQRLDFISKALKKADADIVFMQEVDFHSSRSHKINQAKYLAKKGGYPFFATAPQWKKRLFPDLYGRHGPLNHGLCILSKFPLKNNQSKVFPLLGKAPFFLKWLYNPHGAQKVDVTIGKKTITLMNIHLDPWSPKEREKQIEKVLNWIEGDDKPIIMGGDFNMEPLEAELKKTSHLKDTPWFISLKIEDLKKEQTIQLLKKKGFSTFITKESYTENPAIYYTFPSYAPDVTLDYIFTNKKAKMVKGRVFNEALKASDHLPMIAEVTY